MAALYEQAADQAAANDPDALETQEWLDALQGVLEQEGPQRAHQLLEALIDKARRSGAYIPYSPNTAYINHIWRANATDYGHRKRRTLSPLTKRGVEIRR